MIRSIEYGMGEDFIDQNESIVRPEMLMFWLIGKGLMKKESINAMLSNGMFNLQSVFYDENYSLMPNRCPSEEFVSFKSIELLAEFMSGVDIYEQRLIDILKEHNYKILDCKEFDEEYERTCNISLQEVLDSCETY
jgi:hypothetical protein